jgi:hypothetical protein
VTTYLMWLETAADLPLWIFVGGAGGGIRTLEPLRDWSLSPTPLAMLGDPRREGGWPLEPLKCFPNAARALAAPRRRAESVGTHTTDTFGHVFMSRQPALVTGEKRRRLAFDLGGYPSLVIVAVILAVVVGGVLAVSRVAGPLVDAGVIFSVVIWLVVWASFRLRENSDALP